MNSSFYRHLSLPFVTIIAILFSSTLLHAKDGDTIHVETVQFTGSQSGKWLFPPDSVQYQKILINYTEQCPCGQWDYLEYVYINYRDTIKHDTVSYEILRFITPYGNGMSGSFTWTQDVSDYAPLLHDSVWLSASNGQEPIDVSFDLITGTPPRNVLSIQPLWSGDPGFGGTPSIDSTFFTLKRVFIPDSAKGALLKVIQTGHGFGGDTVGEGDSIYSDDCAEFCGKMQNIWIGDTLRYYREVWRSTCGLNPVAAQGGTWVYNRSNWCPGSVVTPFDYEVTPFMTRGDSLDLRIQMQPYIYVRDTSGTSPYYAVSSFLCLYSAPNFTNDASIEDIIQPTMRDEYRRLNPICASPVIVIRNSGADTMKSLSITYGVMGGNHSTYQWTGSLPFLQTQQVTLPSFDWGNISDTNTFEVTVSNPNGAPDQYAPNNYESSKFILPPKYYNNLEVRVQTNLDAAPQYVWSLTNSNDSVFASGSDLSDNTAYDDSLYLPDGCYTFVFTNLWNYGINWWATSPFLGTGSVELTSLGSSEYSPSGDFGQEIYEQFRVGAFPTVQVITDSLSFGYVDTTSQKMMTAYITPQNSQGLVISNVSMLSLQKYFKEVSTAPIADSGGNINLAFGDTLAVKIAFTPLKSGSWWGHVNIGTNDPRNSDIVIYCTGNGGIASSVEQQPGIPIVPNLQLSAAPNVFTGQSVVSFSSDYSGQSHVFVVNALGREVQVLYDGNVNSEIHSVPFSSAGLPAGMYFIVMHVGDAQRSVPVVVVK